MNFALSDEHILLRDSAANFVDQETDHSTLLVPGATVEDASYPANWQQLVDLGWPSLIVPEAYGGAGLGCVDLSVVVAELGRTLYSSPFAGHTFATWALMLGASEAQKELLLPTAVSGADILALVPPIDGNRVSVDGGRLDGEHEFVIDALGANKLVVSAFDGSSWGFYIVDSDADGVTVRVQPWRDITRQVCKVSFKNVLAEKMPGDVKIMWPKLLDRIACYLAAENVGGMRQVLKDSVEYANERVAFGRPIGAYQAIKHPLAEMLGKVESASTAVLFSAWALDGDDERASMAASMAKAFSCDAYLQATHRNIQIFGAIGFTWEMKNHLYYKRARGNAELFGTIRSHRDNVVNMATDKVWSKPFDLDAAAQGANFAA